MAGENNGGNSKIFQLVMVLVTSIVAPVTVYFSTRAIDGQRAAQQAAVTNPPALSAADGRASVAGALDTARGGSPTLTGTPAGTGTPTFTGTSIFTGAPTVAHTATRTRVPTRTSSPTPTPFGVVDPAGTLAAGTPAAAGSLAAWIEPGDARQQGMYLGFDLRVRNVSKKAQTLSFSPRSVAVQDGAGHALEVLMGSSKRDACGKKELDAVRKVQVPAGGEIVLKSVSPDSPSAWCARGATDRLPLYVLPVGDDPRPLRVALNKFGPFNGFMLAIEPE